MPSRGLKQLHSTYATVLEKYLYFGFAFISGTMGLMLLTVDGYRFMSLVPGVMLLIAVTLLRRTVNTLVDGAYAEESQLVLMKNGKEILIGYDTIDSVEYRSPARSEYLKIRLDRPIDGCREFVIMTKKTGRPFRQNPNIVDFINSIKKFSNKTHE